MVYRIDPDVDRRYVEEFRRRPIGAHSPGLMRVLAIMRNDPSRHQVILVCRKPFAEWVLASMPPERREPIVFDGGPVFTSREAAEWAVFCRRWRLLTGETIDGLSSDGPLPETRPPC